MVYDDKMPEDNLAFIRSFSKEHILFEIAALNYRLKPKFKLQYDDSWENQLVELKYFAKTDRIYNKIHSAATKHNRGSKEFVTIFNRQACTYAIEQIINDQDFVTIPDFNMRREEVWENIIKYFLVVNTIVSEIKEEKDEEEHSFETLNPRILPLNELIIASDPIFTPLRGLKLIEFIQYEEYYEKEFEDYIQTLYGINPIEFVSRIMSLYMSNTNAKPEWEFFYLAREDDSFIKVLSKRHINQKTNSLLSIKKSPFIEVGNNKYLISDNVFLIEKTYNQLVNDFWFDYIKPLYNKTKDDRYNVEYYRSIFGYFFESYVDEVIRNLFAYYKYSSLFTFSELKFMVSKNQIEIADIYFRYGKRILLGQVKGGNIYDKEKYGGSTEDLYKKDRNKFFENFGVNQIVSSIENMDMYINGLDNKYPKGHPIIVFPVIIVNDKSMQTPLMADTFNIRFQELIGNISIKKMIIKPLSLIHISDLERLQYSINKTPQRIWGLLETHINDKRFIPPFYDTLNRFHQDFNYSTEILPYFKKMLDKK